MNTVDTATSAASATVTASYAHAYLGHLAGLGLRDVVAIGSSLGGWIAAEMAAHDTSGALGAVVLVDGAGITVEDEPSTDFFSLTPREVADHAWQYPDRYFVDPATIPPGRAAMQKANMETVSRIARDMNNPELRGALGAVTIPALAIWGDSDRMFTSGYGRAYAQSIADGRFALVADAGHLPQLEQPESTLALIDEFLDAR